MVLIGAGAAQAVVDQGTGFSNTGPSVDFLFEVQAESASFTPVEGSPGRYSLVAYPGHDSEGAFRYWGEGEYHGVNPQGETLCTTRECTWFMAKWAANGRCW